MIDVPVASGTAARGRPAKRGKGTKRPARAARQKVAGRSRRSGASSRASEAPPLEGALRAWRVSEAKKRRVPAFRILTDRTLQGIASARPRSENELLDVAGMGPTLIQKYGRVILEIVARQRG
jgi:DNA topoisomerase-3